MIFITNNSLQEVLTMYQNILVPLDGSDNAYMALEHAVQLAQTFKSKLYLVNVIDITRLNAYSPAAYGGTLYTLSLIHI